MGILEWKEAFWRGTGALVSWLGLSSSVGEFLDCEYHCRGHRVARGFGHGGQDSFRFPGAREMDRLLLAG